MFLNHKFGFFYVYPFCDWRIIFDIFDNVVYQNIIKRIVFFTINDGYFLPLLTILLYFWGKMGKDTSKPQIKQLHDVMIQIITHQL
ncbi:MAG: hypothetical protein ABS28_02380 [Cryomorphaceae bacterium BACL22 MAG-120619-bin32]|nr:MAG: hypothetical protein ABS28_02380 [Cryomorphaceae bacterium BACL22 MAG-120619-bin32]